MGIVYLLSLLLAANGLLVELNLSQTLSAVLGGTILRYHTSIGVFTFSLGLGSLLFPWFESRFSVKKIIVFSNLVVGLVAILGPHFIIKIDPLGHIEFESLLIIFCYLPIIILGAVTGLEIPTLFKMIKNSDRMQVEHRLILSFDYLGMFLVSLLFPFLLLSFGLFNLINISVALTFIIFLFAFGLKDKSLREELTIETGIKLSAKVLGIFFVVFTVSFCSMSYELILAKIFTDLISNEILAHSVTVGIYLLGLGVGAFSTEKSKNDELKRLITTEIILIFTAILLIPVTYMAYDFWKIWFVNYINSYCFFAIAQFFTLWVGYLSGRELPLCIDLLSKETKGGLSPILASNYFGALVAGFVVPLIFLPDWGISGGMYVSSFLNFVIVTLLITFYLSWKKVSYKVLMAMGFILFLFTKAPQMNKLSEQVYLKTYYHEIGISHLSYSSIKNYFTLLNTFDDVIRVHTPYQYIDLVRVQLPYSGGDIGTLGLYLNKQPQFSMDTWRLYHDSFSYGAINLSQKIPQDILILGGGDGLLASLLAEIEGVQSMTMVELDQKMLEFSSKHHEISKANKGVLSGEKLKIVHDDAYSWLRRNKIKYDAIFIDFPYPTSFELSRLYSVEFYELIYNHIKKEGFMVMDAPVSFSLDPSAKNKSPILLNTLRRAGFEGVFPFGPVEPFVYAEKKKRKFKFNYTQLKKLKNHSFLNQSSIISWFDRVKDDGQTINSLYHPVFLEFNL